MYNFKKILLFSFMVFALMSNTFALVNTGEKVPNLELSGWAKGPELPLDTMSKGGKVTVLYIWGLSQKAIELFPEIIKLYNQYKNENVQFIAVALDSLPSVKTFYGLKDLPFSVASDNELKTIKTYLRSKDSLPMFAIIDKDGTLCWRGNLKVLPFVLKDVLSGKFDIQKQIHNDNFSDKLTTQLRIKDYITAVRLLDEELKNNPRNLELIVLKAQLTAIPLKRPGEALTFLKNKLAEIPKSLTLHNTAIEILTVTKKIPALSVWYDMIIKEYINDKPMVLLAYAAKEISHQESMPNLEIALKLAKAAENSTIQKSNQEKIAIAMTLSKIYYLCCAPKPAYEQINDVLNLVEDPKQKEKMEQLVEYYENIAEISEDIKERE